MARPVVPDALQQSHSCPLWLSTVGAVLPSPCYECPGSHRLWSLSESVVTPAPPAIVGAPDLPKTLPQQPLRSGCGYTLWNKSVLQTSVKDNVGDVFVFLSVVDALNFHFDVESFVQSAEQDRDEI